MKTLKLLLPLYLSIASLSAMEEMEIVPLKKNPTIKKLNLSETMLMPTKERLLDTTFLTRFDNLTELNLSICCRIKRLDHVATLTTLRKLNLSHCIKALFDLPKLESLVNLQELHLSFLYVDYAFKKRQRNNFPTLEFLISMTKLKKLFLVCNEYLTGIEPITRLPKLKHLDITGCVSLQDAECLDACDHINIIGNEFVFEDEPGTTYETYHIDEDGEIHVLTPAK